MYAVCRENPFLMTWGMLCPKKENYMKRFFLWKLTAVILTALCFFCLSGCRNFDPFGTEARQQAEKNEQLRLARLQVIEEKKNNTPQGEDFMAYMHRVSNWGKQEEGHWVFEIEEGLNPFADISNNDSLLNKLELESLDWLNIPKFSFQTGPKFWTEFLETKALNGFFLGDIEGLFLKGEEIEGLRPSRYRNFFKQKGIAFAITSMLNSRETGLYNVHVAKVSLNWGNKFLSARDNFYRLINEKYTSFIRNGYGDPLQMKSILTFLLDISSEKYLLSHHWVFEEDGTLYKSGASLDVYGIISSTLKGNGWCETVAKVKRNFPEYRDYTLMIRTQISPDGIPLFIEYFSL